MLTDGRTDWRTDWRTDGRTDGRTENRTPISHPATSRCDKNHMFWKVIVYTCWQDLAKEIDTHTHAHTLTHTYTHNNFITVFRGSKQKPCHLNNHFVSKQKYIDDIEEKFCVINSFCLDTTLLGSTFKPSYILNHLIMTRLIKQFRHVIPQQRLGATCTSVQSDQDFYRIVSG